MATKIYSCSVYTPDDRMIQIVFDGADTRVSVTGGNMSGDEASAAHVISEVMRCLNNGKRIDSHFSPMEDETLSIQLVRCEWLRSGKLRINVEQETRRFNHADTVDQAVSRKRIFTCTRALYKRLPSSRGS